MAVVEPTGQAVSNCLVNPCISSLLQWRLPVFFVCLFFRKYYIGSQPAALQCGCRVIVSRNSMCRLFLKQAPRNGDLCGHREAICSRRSGKICPRRSCFILAFHDARCQLIDEAAPFTPRRPKRPIAIVASWRLRSSKDTCPG